ncbi:MAG: ABC transporter permease [Candidatus Eisenbacteria bacterium]
MKLPRARMASALNLAAPLVAVLAALAVGAVFIASIGEAPLEIYALMFHEAFGTGYGLGQTLFKTTPLLFTGLAVSLAFRAGLFNIGVESQMYLGGLAAALVGSYVALPGVLLLAASLLAAALAGSAWAAIPGALKARFGSHEVINTIMLNFIALSLVAWVGRGLFEAATVRTLEVAPAAWLPRLDGVLPALHGAPANVSLLLGLLLALGVGVLLFRTRLGFDLRALGLNAPAAQAAGVAIGRTQILAMGLSGAIAGLGGVNFVLGYKHYFELEFTGGAGFIGIAVALLGRNHPLGVLLAALFFGGLSHGALVINQRVPRELVNVLQGLVILFAISAQALAARLGRRWA